MEKTTASPPLAQAQQVHDALEQLLAVLNDGATRNNSSRNKNSDETTSSSADANSRTSSGGYELRRASRRLWRALEQLEAALMMRDEVSNNDDHHPVVLQHQQQQQQAWNATPQSSAMWTEDLVTIATLPKQPQSHGGIDDENDAYLNAVHVACRILGQFAPLPLPDEAVDALLDRIAAVLLLRQQNNQKKDNGSNDAFLLPVMAAIVNTSLAEREEEEANHNSEQHDDDDGGNPTRISLLSLSVLETMQFLELLVQRCLLGDLAIRWQAPSSDHHKDDDHNSTQQGRMELRMLVLYLLKHLAAAVAEGMGTNAGTTVDVSQTAPTTTATALEAFVVNRGHGAISISMQDDVGRFQDSIGNLALEMTEYALDVLDGASAWLVAALGNAPSSSSSSSSDELLEPVLQDAIRHVSLAMSVCEILHHYHEEEGRGAAACQHHHHLLPWNPTTLAALKTLFVSYANFVASTGHQVLQVLDGVVMAVDAPSTTRTIADELLVRLSVLVATAVPQQQQQQQQQPSFDPKLNHAVAITILRALDTPQGIDLLEPLLQRYYSTNDDGMMHVLQAAAMSLMILPNIMTTTSTTIPKEPQVAKLLAPLVVVQSSESSSSSRNAWNALLSRMIGECGFSSSHSSVVDGEQQQNDETTSRQVLSEFVRMTDASATTTGDLGL